MPTPSQLKEIYARRKQGIYICDETLDELTEILTNQIDADDVAVTLVHSIGGFSRLNQRELLQQILIWKQMKIKCKPYNIKEIQIAGKTYHTFIIQPDGYETISPLGLALNILVSGFTYVCPKKSTAELVVRALKQ